MKILITGGPGFIDSAIMRQYIAETEHHILNVDKLTYARTAPYSASKAASDHVVRVWQSTYSSPVVITNRSNNFGPYQFSEKLIPLMTLNALAGKPLPVYGNRDKVRNWFYVEDHAGALREVPTKGTLGRTYNIEGQSEKTNLEVVGAPCATMDGTRPDPAARYERLIEHVADRPSHNRRSTIDDSRITRELGWRPRESFETGLKKTLCCYQRKNWGQITENRRYAESRRETGGQTTLSARTVAGNYGPSQVFIRA